MDAGETGGIGADRNYRDHDFRGRGGECTITDAYRQRMHSRLAQGVAVDLTGRRVDVDPVRIGRERTGQRIAIDPHAWDTFLPVVGVVADVRSGDITGPPEAAMYVSLAEGPTRDVTLVVRAGGAGGTLTPAVRRAVLDVDPTVPVRSVMWMSWCY